MLNIFEFYLNQVLKIFNSILQRFEVSDGLGFGTFLLGCSLFVIFVNLLKFEFGTNGISEIKSYYSRKAELKAKHLQGKHVRR